MNINELLYIAIYIAVVGGLPLLAMNVYIWITDNYKIVKKKKI